MEDRRSVDRRRQERTGFDALAFVLAVLLREWKTIALVTGAFLAAAVAFVVLSTPLYLARSQLIFDPRAKQVLQTEVVPTGLGSSAAGPDTLLLDSQIEVILSDPVLRRVIAALDLLSDEEFAELPGRGLLVRLGLRSDPTIGLSETARAEAAMIKNLRKRLNVRRVGNTYVVNVDARATTPAKAARIADAVAEAFLAEESETVRNTTRQTSRMLAAKLGELREQLDAADRRVQEYRGQHGLIAAENSLTAEQQLRELNDRVVAARARTSDARVKYERVRNLTAASALADSSEAISSTVIANLRLAYANVDRQQVASTALLGPRHPTYQALEAERRGIARAIEEELARIKRNAEHEYQVAARQEEALTQELERLRTVVDRQNHAMVTLRQLQREAEAARAVYESFLLRTRQTTEQEDLGGSNSRILTRATAVVQRVYPPVAIVLAGSLVLGLLFGSLAAWLGRGHGAPAVPLQRPQPPVRLETAA